MDRDTEPAEVLGTAQRTPATVASLRHKSYRNTATRVTGGSGQRRERETLRPHRNSTAEQREAQRTLTPERREPTDETAPRRDTRTAADRTRSDGQRTAESDQTEDANAQHKINRQGHEAVSPEAANAAAGDNGSKKTTSNQALQLATYNTQQSCLSVFDPLSHLVISLSMFMRFASSPGSLLGRDNCGFLDLTNDG